MSRLSRKAERALSVIVLIPCTAATAAVIYGIRVTAEAYVDRGGPLDLLGQLFGLCILAVVGAGAAKWTLDWVEQLFSAEGQASDDDCGNGG